MNGRERCELQQPFENKETSSHSNNKCRKKSRWKLKFHHQALPAQYLNHYESSLERPQSSMPVIPQNPPSTNNKYTASVSIPVQIPMSVTNVKTDCISATHAGGVKYEDLPFMGEITLSNAKPRRGRKPKKADICHLIYKNYGTTVLDEPLNLCLRDHQNSVLVPLDKISSQISSSNSTNRSKVTTSTLSKSTLQQQSQNSIRKNGKRRKKKSVSVNREILEKTFKEKGFLIQTQQLQSNEGATYCKFRQLRKFTRYLFRSWKHHLPCDVAVGQ